MALVLCPNQFFVLVPKQKNSFLAGENDDECEEQKKVNKKRERDEMSTTRLSGDDDAAVALHNDGHKSLAAAVKICKNIFMTPY